jgi:hypothetical protein
MHDDMTDEPEPMGDAGKHAWCLKNTGYRAACVTPLTYAKLERDGHDMRHYTIWKSVPTLRSPSTHATVELDPVTAHATIKLDPVTNDPDPVTDAEKHAWCQKRGYPHALFLGSNLYAAAEHEGLDMRWYVLQKPMPRMTKAEENAILRGIMQ